MANYETDADVDEDLGPALRLREQLARLVVRSELAEPMARVRGLVRVQLERALGAVTTSGAGYEAEEAILSQ